MLGYMTAAEAKAEGFTHHGKYFGIPVWMSDDATPMVATKWAPMEYVMSAFHEIEGLLRDVFMSQDEPGFQFWMGRKIE
jgi:hypothetical protein